MPDHHGYLLAVYGLHKVLLDGTMSYWWETLKQASGEQFELQSEVVAAGRSLGPATLSTSGSAGWVVGQLWYPRQEDYPNGKLVAQLLAYNGRVQ